MRYVKLAVIVKNAYSREIETLITSATPDVINVKLFVAITTAQPAPPKDVNRYRRLV